MIESTVIRFEASDIEPAIDDDLGLLVMQTTQDGRVAIHMRRDVFVSLFERMQIALGDKASRATPQSDD